MSSSRQGRRPQRFPDRPKHGTASELVRQLRSLDRSSYGAYNRVLGTWDYDDFQVLIDRIQSDPYAPPSSIRIVTTPAKIGLPETATDTPDQRLGTEDFLLRSFRDRLREEPGRSPLSAAPTTQEILDRSAALVTPDRVELRVQVQLPARGRTILGQQAARIFEEDLPRIVRDVFGFAGEDGAPYREELTQHIHTLEDYTALTVALDERGWVAFVADGASLPRLSGTSQLPLPDAVPFAAPPELAETVTLPHAGEVLGMAIKPGITLIVGGGYHGKSTLLSAIERGVYPHIPGDGRELVATSARAMKIRAADGRPVTKVDVSAFINHLPTGANTQQFSTQNASGSTSQAASICESLGVGVPLLLIDEDTSATNLMIRDERMRALVTAGQEPITPLIDRIRNLASDGTETSVILVMGGSGAYLDVADRVLQMDSYLCRDVTANARRVAEEYPRAHRENLPFPPLTSRAPLHVRGEERKPRTRASGVDEITLDRQVIDVSDVEQIVDPGQTTAIAWALRGIFRELADGVKTVPELMGELETLLDADGLDALVRFGARRHPAFLTRPRAVDVAAALDRYRALQINAEPAPQED